ncbi:hypothetical protein [Rhizobium leguminosarum]|uniref:hypothetical protein n=1 Tax=Rhizobium leguminosarum TaxID=384 RepID=UPI001AE716A3|nr:hypothetical protein [Rhizobium leguminosarum]MBP2443808.1 hypothetical protein [Rhizobium leguminosarum]
MRRGKFKLIRKPSPRPKVNSGADNQQGHSADESRKRIQALVDELNQINTKADIKAAEARGLPFNHEAFASWCGVGTDTLRKKNGDLYVVLKGRLTHLEEVAGRALRGRRAKELDPSDKKRKNRDEKESDEMKALRQELDREKTLRIKGEEEILRLVGQLRSALHTRAT